MNKFYNRHFPGLLLFVIVFTPTIPSLAPLRIEDILIGVAVALISLFPKRKPIRISQQLEVGTGLAIIAVAGGFGMLGGMVFLGIIPVTRDLFFIPQLIKYFLLFWIMCKTFTGERAISTFCVYVCVCALGSSLIAITQFWNLFGVNNWLTPFFFNKELALQQMQDAKINFRVTGTMNNPNYFGYLLCWLISWALSMFLFVKRNALTKFTLLPLMGLIMIALLLLQSRTSFLSLFCMVVAVFLLLKSMRKHILILLSVIFVGGVVTVFLKSDILGGRGYGARLSLDNDSTVVSYNARVRDLVRPCIYALEHPYLIPFGQGPSKGGLRTDSHNGFTWMLQRFGVSGMGMYVMLIFWKQHYARKLLRSRRVSPESRGIAVVAICACIVWILGDFGGNIFKDPRLMSLNFISMSALYAVSRRSKRASARWRAPVL